MTITPTAIEAAGLCAYLTMLAGLVAFAIYDIRTKRVPNMGLALFVPIVLACTILRCMAESWDSVLFYTLYSVAGAVAGGGVLLAAALATKGGIGGGDIKLAALIGLFYGPHGMLLALLTGTPIAIFYGLIKRRRCGDKKLHIAFVPFITIGCFLTSIVLIKGVFAL